MTSGMWNLAFGLVAVAAGASGRFALLGTQSSTGLEIVGGLVALLGAYQLWRDRRRDPHQ